MTAACADQLTLVGVFEGPRRRRPGLARKSGQHRLDMAREHVLGGPLTLERNFRRHRTFGPHAADRRPNSLERIADRRVGGRRLVAAMGHAIGAFFIAAGAIAVPVGRLHQFLEDADVALAQEVAGLLPTEHVAGRHAPGRAVKLLIARQEVQETAANVETAICGPCPARTP